MGWRAAARLHACMAAGVLWGRCQIAAVHTFTLRGTRCMPQANMHAQPGQSTYIYARMSLPGCAQRMHFHHRGNASTVKKGSTRGDHRQRALQAPMDWDYALDRTTSKVPLPKVSSATC